MLIVGQVHSCGVQQRGEYTNYNCVIKVTAKNFIKLDLTKFQYEYIGNYRGVANFDVIVSGRVYTDKDGNEQCINTISTHMLTKVSELKTESNDSVIDPKKMDVSDVFDIPTSSSNTSDLPF